MLPEHTEGCALFADVSGFTVLTKALVEQLGQRRGAEALARQINQVYTALIDPVERWRGSVIGFSGDGLTCWFDAANGPPAARAAACALAMQRAIRTLAGTASPGLPATLSLKVAVASGPARRLAPGDPALQQFDLLAGATLLRAALIEQHARPGEVLLDQPTATALGPTAAVKQRLAASDLLCLELLDLESLPVPQPWPDLPEVKLEHLRSWLPVVVVERAEAGLGDFLAELRPVVPLFVRFGGLDYDHDPQAAARLDDLVRTAQHALAHYGGTLLHVTLGDKGSSLYAIFGAPVAHQDDPQRAMLAALDIQEASATLGGLTPLQVGIAGGTLLVGVYGGVSRRTFDALGDAANLAARLMMHAAPGEILTTARLLPPASTGLALEERPPALLKGRAEAEPLLAVRRARHRRSGGLAVTIATALAGREHELAQIEQALAQTLAGNGRAVIISGEAGAGKSRLLAEAMRLAQQHGLLCYSAAAQATSATKPYALWEPIWQAFFNLDPELPPPQQAVLLAQRLDQLAPLRAKALPLLGGLLDLALPDNDLTRALEPKERQGALHALLRDCLSSAAREAQAHGGGLVLALDDLHWIDPASHELLVELAECIVALPVLILAAERPNHQNPRRTTAITLLEDTLQLVLEGLGRAAAEQLIRERAALLFPALEGTLPGQIVDQLIIRSQGSPFYLEELLNYLRDRQIDPCDPYALDRIELPESLHSLVLSRLDQLTLRQQALLKHASVIGRRFLVAWLQGAFVGAPTDHATTDLAALEQHDLALRDTSAPTLAYLFKHLVTQEVAYTSLSEDARAVLHECLAGYLERLAGDTPDLLIDLLAYHYDRSANLAKRRLYLRRAGEAAAARFANDSALDYLSRAFDLAPVDDLRERYELLLAREALADRRADRAAQQRDLALLAELAEALGEAERTCVLVRRAKLATMQGDYDAAMVQTARATAMAEQAGLSGELIQALLIWAQALCQQGDYPAARVHARRAAATAQALGDQRRESEALRRLGIIAAEQSDYPTARGCYQQALVLARAAGDRYGESNCLNNLGIVALYGSDYAAARDFYGQALPIAQAIGDRRVEVIILSNLGMVAFYQRDYAAARSFYGQALPVARAIGDRQIEAALLNGLGALDGDQGDYTAGRRSYQQALVITRELGDPHTESYVLANLATVAHSLGQYAQAQQGYEQALAQRRVLGDRLGESAVLYYLALLHHQQGRDSEALELAWQAHSIAEQIGGTSEQANALLVHGHALAGLGWPEEAAASYRAALALQQQLGQQHRIAEAYAGLARLALGQDDLPAALDAVNAILDGFAGTSLGGADEPLRVLLTCVEVLAATGDPRGPTVLAAARQELLRRAGLQTDPKEQRVYLEEIEAHRRIMGWPAA
ncbi:MAG: adenylate/guanylate cyclase domain-containing protein [Roseiflexaceae bacterium]